MTGKRPILAIIGPTAGGKSALAAELARQRGGEILSVDSMQIYRGMDIGTAKPTAAERREIRHHLIDIAGPDESFSAARFVELADAVIAESSAPLIATGGTPMYFKALFEGLFEGPSADEALRSELGNLSGEELHARLAAIDPQAAARIHVADTRRLIRAIEVHHHTGQPISALQTQWKADREPRHRAVWIGLQWDRDELNRRINARVKEMIAAGWVEEVQNLVREHPKLSKSASEATGYAELIGHIEGRWSLEDAVEQIKIATRQLARRQMKWFRRFEHVHWLSGRAAVAENAAAAGRIWDEMAGKNG
jgi:tRNA dimethylallyltransferase